MHRIHAFCVYVGEVKVFEDTINKFLKLANDLKLNHISQFAPETVLKIKGEPSMDESGIDCNIDTVHLKSNAYIENQNDSYILLTNTDTMSRARLDNTTTNHRLVLGKQILYNCEDCDLVFKKRFALLRHRTSKHKLISYSCYQCEYQASNPSNLKDHQECKHKSVQRVYIRVTSVNIRQEKHL